MTTKRLAHCTVLSTLIDEIIMERIMTQSLSAGGEIPLKEIARQTKHKKRDIKVLKKYDNDLFCLESDTIKVISDNDLISQNLNKYIKCLIKKNVYTSQYPLDSFENGVGKLINDKYYTTAESEFINDIYNKFIDISKLEINNVALSDTTLLQYNFALHYKGFNYVARGIYNGIIQGDLRCGDDITDILRFSELFKLSRQNLIGYSDFFHSFFRFDENNRAILQCDLENNRELFDLNFFNTLIYTLHDDTAIIKLLRQIQAKFGSILR